MKNVFVVLAVTVSIACCMALCACGQTIKGSPSTVVKECQDLSMNDKPTIEVTGEYRSKDTDSQQFSIVDGDYTVHVWMADSEKGKMRLSGRTTFRGTLVPMATDSDEITIKDATIVK